MIGVEIKRASGESNTSVMRRFSKRVLSGGYVRRVKTNRYRSRPQSTLNKQRRAIKRTIRVASIERLKKLGKLSDTFVKKSR